MHLRVHFFFVEVGMLNLEVQVSDNRTVTIPIGVMVPLPNTETVDTLAEVVKRISNLEEIRVKDFGATSDGTLHTVQEWYTLGSLEYRGYSDYAAVLVDYPFLDSNTVSTDYAAAKAAHDFLYANRLKNRTIKLSGCNIWNRELVIKLPMTIDGGTRCSPHRAGWNTNRPDASSIVMVGDGDICRTIRTRRLYRASVSDPQDAPMNAAINVQSHGFVAKNITIQNDYDPVSLSSDVGTLVPVVLPTVDANGNYVAPNYYGAPAIKKRMYRGAGWDCGVFVGAQYSKKFENVGIYCFREYGLYHSSADQGFYINAGKRVGCKPFKDWQGNELIHTLDSFQPTVPSGTSVGADGLDIYGCHFLGNQVGIALHGALPKLGLLTYGRDYKSRVSIRLTRMPNANEYFDVGSYDLDNANPPNKSNYRYVRVKFVTDVGEDEEGLLQSMIRTDINETLNELLSNMQSLASTGEDVETSSDIGARFDSNVYLKEGTDTLVVVSKYFTSSSAKQFLYGLGIRSNSDLISCSSGNTVIGSGYTEYTPIETSDPAPYCWLDGSESPSELALYQSEPGYFLGTVADWRGQIGMSDVSIMNSFLYSVKRNGWDIKQIDIQRRVHTDTDGGSAIWIDGLAGNGSRKIQKISLTNCRIDSMSATAGIRLGLSNGISISNCIPDGYGSGGDIYNPLSSNYYGWLIRNKNTNNSITVMGQNRSNPNVFDFDGSVIYLGSGNAKGRSAYFTGRINTRGYIADLTNLYGSHPYTYMRCGTNGMSSSRLLGKDGQGTTLTYFDGSKNGWLTNTVGNLLVNPASGKYFSIAFGSTEALRFTNTDLLPITDGTYSIGSSTKALSRLVTKKVSVVTTGSQTLLQTYQSNSGT
jgi:hypothetical protein